MGDDTSKNDEEFLSEKSTLRILYMDQEKDILDAWEFLTEGQGLVFDFEPSVKKLIDGNVSLQGYDAVILSLKKTDVPDEFQQMEFEPECMNDVVLGLVAGGIYVLSYLKVAHPDMPIIVQTGIINPAVMEFVTDNFPNVFLLPKPIDLSEPGLIDNVRMHILRILGEKRAKERKPPMGTS